MKSFGFLKLLILILIYVSAKPKEFRVGQVLMNMDVSGAIKFLLLLYYAER